MAITEPSFGSDSAAVKATAVLDGDDYVINGEKIFVTAGGRCDAVVVWASLDRSKGRAAIKSFVVEKGTPGMVVERLEHKLGIRASDTATIRFTDCRVPEGEPARLARDRGRAGLRRRHADLRQHPPARGRDGRRVRAGGAGRDRGPAQAGRRRGRLRQAGVQPARRGRGLPADGGRLGGRLPADDGGHLDGRQQQAELAAGVDGQGEGRPGRRRDHAALRRARRRAGLQRGLAAGEVGPRLEDPRHLRGHPADPAADRRPAAAQQVVHRTK